VLSTLVSHYPLLDAGCWITAFINDLCSRICLGFVIWDFSLNGHWLLDIDYWLLDNVTCYSMLDAGFWIINGDYSLLIVR